MFSFIKAHQFSAAMEVVMKTWARALRLRREDVMIILTIGHHRRQGTSELGAWTGRARQQVHRNLRSLERKKVVCPSLLSAAGKVMLWALTERGKRIYEVLRDQVTIWEAHLDHVFELEATMHALYRGVSALVNRPHEPGGWERSLQTPRPIETEEVWALEATTRLRELGAEIEAEVVTDDPAKARAIARSVEAKTRLAEQEREYVELVKRLFN